MKTTKLPQFQSKKIIGAVKIKEVKKNMKGGAIIIPEGKKLEPLNVSHKFMITHYPKAGNYYTKDDKGVVSIIDGDEFKENFTTIKKPKKIAK